MTRRFALSACATLIGAAIALALLTASHHRVVVLEGIGGRPIANAHVVLRRSSGPPEPVGRTDANGQLVFWTVPLPVPRLICAEAAPFYPQTCVGAISLSRHFIEFPVPARAP